MTDTMMRSLLAAASLADRFEAETGRPLTAADVALAVALGPDGPSSTMVEKLSTSPGGPNPHPVAKMPQGGKSRDEAATDVGTIVPKNEAHACTDGELPDCPVCRGPMWDNRGCKASGEYKPSAPDLACKKRSCTGRIWKLMDKHVLPAAPATAPDVPSPFDADDDDLPF